MLAESSNESHLSVPLIPYAVSLRTNSNGSSGHAYVPLSFLVSITQEGLGMGHAELSPAIDLQTHMPGPNGKGSRKTGPGPKAGPRGSDECDKD